jgi:hypothetical protein
LTRILGFLYRTFPPFRYWGLRRGFLRQTGWLKSNWRNAPVDADGRPLPWYTFPANHFLSTRVREEMVVFEYGSGNSTLWWAENVSHIDAVEDDRGWYERIESSMPGNVDLQFTSGAQYSGASAARGKKKYDVIVVDGSVRNDCVRECQPALKSDGVIIFDNTDFVGIFDEGIAFLAGGGFSQLEFRGLTATNMDLQTTSIFYRPGKNCLGI